MVAAEDVGEVRAGEALHLGEAVQDALVGGGDRRLDEIVDEEVGGHAELVVGVAGPVEPAAAAEVVLAVGGDHDVVGALAVDLVEPAAGDEDVVADDDAGLLRVEVVAARAVGRPDLDPIVAFVAEGRQVHLGAEDEVVAGPAEGLGHVLTGDDEVAAFTSEEQVEAVAALDDVVAVVALEDVVAADVGDDVVAGAALDVVDAVTALEAIVAAVPPKRVVTDARDEDVGLVGAAQDDVVHPGVPEVVGVLDGRGWVVADDEGQEGSTALYRIIVAVEAEAGELPRLVDLEDEGRRRKDVGGQMEGVGVEHDELRERVVLELGEEVHARGPGEVVEAVAVLQGLHLRLEDEVEGRAEEAAEGHLSLGQTADPEVDAADTGRGDAVDVLGVRTTVGPGAGAVEEVEPVGLVQARITEDEFGGGEPLRLQGPRGQDGPVRAVGRDEVDDGGLVLQVHHQVGPARVRLELGVRGHLVERTTRRVQGGDSGVTSAGDVERGQVKREAQQVVADCLGDELVDLVALLSGHAAHDGAGSLLRAQGAALVELERIEKRIDEGDIVRVEVRV